MKDIPLYQAVRPKLQTGDLLLWASSSILGRLIRWFSKSDVNHAGLVIRFIETDRVFTLEALEFGFVLRALSERLEKHNGSAYWCALSSAYDEIRPAVWKNGMMFVGTDTRYDWFSLLKQAAFRVKADDKRLFCSEACAVIWEKSGIPYTSKFAPRPGDLENDYKDVLLPRVPIK